MKGFWRGPFEQRQLIRFLLKGLLNLLGDILRVHFLKHVSISPFTEVFLFSVLLFLSVISVWLFCYFFPICEILSSLFVCLSSHCLSFFSESVFAFSLSVFAFGTFYCEPLASLLILNCLYLSRKHSWFPANKKSINSVLIHRCRW